MARGARVVALAVLMAASSHAGAAAPSTPLTMTGNYIKTVINNSGTLGNNATTADLCMQYDGTGAQVWNDDVCIAGTPWEGFAVAATNMSIPFLNANNSHAGNFADANPVTKGGGVVWTGTGSDGTHDVMTVTNYYTLAADSHHIKVETTVKALVDLKGVVLSRSIDPDQNGAYDTYNHQGYGSLSATNWVYGSGTASTIVVGLYSNDAVTHNTGISSGGSSWNEDPNWYIGGNNDTATPDDAVIGLAFDLGDMTAGTSKTVTYFYVLADSEADAESYINAKLSAVTSGSTLNSGADSGGGGAFAPIALLCGAGLALRRRRVR